MSPPDLRVCLWPRKNRSDHNGTERSIGLLLNARSIYHLAGPAAGELSRSTEEWGQIMGLRDWLRSVFGGLKAKPIVNPCIEEIHAHLLAAESNGWWRDMTGLVGKTDQQLVVIGPRADVTAEDLKVLGQLLVRWQAEYPQARHIWGVTDLLNGQPPRTPPIYLAVPYPVERFEECYEPVVLVYVAQGTDIEAATRSLSECLSNYHSKLFWFNSPDYYSLCNR